MSSRARSVRSASKRALFLLFFLLLVMAIADRGSAEPEDAAAAATTRSPWDFWINLAHIVGPLATVAAVVAAIQSWRWTFFTKEWSTLIQFIQANSGYMERARTENYKTSFSGPEALKYEMVARLCIGYLDDLYFLGSKRKIRTWFRGSVELLAGTHRRWLEDHEAAYHPGFYRFIMGELQDQAKRQRVSGGDLPVGTHPPTSS